ncbi:FAD-dependent monooxygenase [Streptomyces sp. NPDC048312]|uniref:FAD-dependent monooxygenase n=2 Tax=unclassified Streptomyces TaxID=2593676 RepID=UPI00340445D7
MLHIIDSAVTPNADDTEVTDNVFTAHPSFHESAAARLPRFTYKARQAGRYRYGRILLAGEAAHLFPATGVAVNAGMADLQNWARPGLPDTYHAERHLVGGRTMLHTRATTGGLSGTAHRRAAAAPHGNAHRRSPHPLPHARRLSPSDGRYLRPPDLVLHTDKDVTGVA